MTDERGPLTMRRFIFDRQSDVSGTSGIGAVVEGVEFSDGQVVLRWRTTPHSSISIYKSMEAAVYIHGHDGSTNLRYLDTDEEILALAATFEDETAGRDEACLLGTQEAEHE